MAYWGSSKRRKVFVTQEEAALDRFWSYVNVAPGDKCWLWNTTPNGSGYGDIYINGKLIQSHRFMWEITYGPIPIGLCVLHRCDIRLCVNPEHLFLGTKKDNMQDAISKDRLYLHGKIPRPQRKVFSILNEDQ